eukprot:TRINITY_DN12601_c0_g1_i1.p1 TRINITY_DN12601_c0_g1~~TRINITY_DN12601_c0_g1_i1.p1  ORF type:complete len:623 (-),score=110.03 TRINITY_DN12601_c0_g1_i1:23-1891(-)
MGPPSDTASVKAVKANAARSGVSEAPEVGGNVASSAKSGSADVPKADGRQSIAHQVDPKSSSPNSVLSVSSKTVRSQGSTQQLEGKVTTGSRASLALPKTGLNQSSAHQIEAKVSSRSSVSSASLTTNAHHGSINHEDTKASSRKSGVLALPKAGGNQSSTHQIEAKGSNRSSVSSASSSAHHGSINQEDTKASSRKSGVLALPKAAGSQSSTHHIGTNVRSHAMTDPTKRVVAEGFLDARKKRGAMRKYFILTSESIDYWDNEADAKTGRPYRGHVRHCDVLKLEPVNLGFSLYTIHSRKPLELSTSSFADWLVWKEAWAQVLYDRFMAGAGDQDEREAAATKIGSVARMHLAKKRVSQLPSTESFVQTIQARLARQAASREKSKRKVLLREGNISADSELFSKIFPWRKPMWGIKQRLVKGGSTWRQPEKTICPPVPQGFHAQKFQLCRLADLKFAFKMIDKVDEGVLGRADSRAFLRCLGWCVTEKVLDDTLDQVDVEGLSPRKAVRKPIRLRGPWNFQQLVAAHNILQQVGHNGGEEELLEALEILTDKTSDSAFAFEDLERLLSGVFDEDGDSRVIAKAIRVGQHEHGSQLVDVNLREAALRVIDRIVHPVSVNDVP